MRRPGLLLALVVLALALVPFSRWLVHRADVQRLGDALVADLDAAQKAVVTRATPTDLPRHDDGFRCFSALLEVSPRELAPFVGEAAVTVLAAPEPSAEVQARMRELAPWFASLRDCGSSRLLGPAKNLTPGAQPSVPPARVAEALVTYTAVETRALTADGQVELALERCTGTWELVFDLTHLGFEGAAAAGRAVTALTPACTEALGKLKPESQAKVKKSWGELEGRLAPAAKLVERARLEGSLQKFAGSLPAEKRARLPAVPAQDERAADWAAWDAAMRTLAQRAAAPGAERKEAASAAALGENDLEAKLAAYDETRAKVKALGAP